MMTTFDHQRNDWHRAGIHVRCERKRKTTWKHLGDGTYQDCPDAGRIARFHHHDFDGPLPCHCDDFGDDDF